MCLRCELEPPNTADRSEDTAQVSFSSDLQAHVMVSLWDPFLFYAGRIIINTAELTDPAAAAEYNIA